MTNVAAGQDVSPVLGPSRPPPEPSESGRSTQPPASNEDEYEASSYDELIKDGGRPVCPILVLLRIMNDPAASCEAALPWLSDADSAGRDGEIQTVFSRQLERWWEFRKWQWANRGIAGGDRGFAAFFEAKKSKFRRIGAHEVVIDPSFEETVRRLWQQKPELRQLSENQGFSAYRDALKGRLATHNFSRPLQLKNDPRLQDGWNTWLEYLNFEYWWLEQHAIAAEPKERQYRQAWKRLLEALRPPSNGGAEPPGTKDSLDSPISTGASGPLPSRQWRRNSKTAALAEELAAARADLDTTKKAVGNFIRDTAPYRRAETAAYDQRRRVQWVLAEARVMEAETSKHQGTAKLSSGLDVRNSTKRMRSNDDGDNDDNDEPLGRRAKRTKEGDGENDAVADTATVEPRRSRRLGPPKSSATRSLRSSSQWEQGGVTRKQRSRN